MFLGLNPSPLPSLEGSGKWFLLTYYLRGFEMEFVITINLDNAAFEEAGPEVARILRQLADDIENDNKTDRKLRDINGNTVGHTGLVKTD